MNEMDRITIEEMSKIGINIANPNQPVGTMSGGQRQTLEVQNNLFCSENINIR